MIDQSIPNQNPNGGWITKTVYGNIQLDFNNTKIIRNGRVLSLEEAEMIGAGGGTHFVDSLGTTVEELGKANEKVVADMGNAEEDIPRNI